MRLALCASMFLAGVQTICAGTIAGKVVCNGPVNNCGAVIYAERTPKTEVHPPKNPVVLDQSNLTFVPHVLPVVVGTTVVFPNHDEVPHNVFSSSTPKIFNVGIYPKGSSRRVNFDKPGEVRLLCNIHPQMSAFILVLPQPYFVVASAHGEFQLKDLPPGKYKVTIWHERYQPVSRTLEIKAAEKVPMRIELRELRRTEASDESHAHALTPVP